MPIWSSSQNPHLNNIKDGLLYYDIERIINAALLEESYSVSKVLTISAAKLRPLLEQKRAEVRQAESFKTYMAQLEIEIR